MLRSRHTASSSTYSLQVAQLPASEFPAGPRLLPTRIAAQAGSARTLPLRRSRPPDRRARPCDPSAH